MTASSGPKPLNLKVLIHQESDSDGTEAYIAQCLNFDLTAQGQTISEVLNSMQRVVRAQVLLSLNDGIEPFSDFEPAPTRLWEIYDTIQEHEQKAFTFLANIEPGDLDEQSIKVSRGVKVCSLMKIAS
jgi:hypothetical protein